MVCSDEVPYTGEGRIGDYLLQNARASAIIRTPAEALTLLDLPGGTLVDFVHLDRYDVVFEAVPLIDRGWMVSEEVETGADADSAWLTLRGSTWPIGALGGSEGRPAELTWRLRADSDRVEIEGAEGLYIQGRTNTYLVDEHLARWDVRLQPVDAAGRPAPLVEDLGGALIYEGVGAVLSGPADDVYRALWPEGQAVSGSCPEGERVEVRAGERVLAWLEPEFDTRVPAEADALVCAATGRADGVPVPPELDLALAPGAETALLVRVADHLGEDVPAVVQWGPGEDQRAPVPPGGGEVYPGVGDYELRVSYGPRADTWEGRVSVPEGGARVDVVLNRRIDSEGWIAADLFRAPWPSRYSRRFPSDDLTLAAAEGFTYVVQAPPDEVAQPYQDADQERWTDALLRYEAGSLADTDAGRIWSWSWSGSTRYAGHGAVAWSGLSPEDALALASDGLEPYRKNVVDAAWLAAAGPPHMWNPPPMMVAIQDAGELPLLLEVFEAGYYPGVVGPVTWLPAETSSLPSLAACQRGLLTGQSVGSSGPLLTLSAGEPIDLGPWIHPLHVRLQSRPEDALSVLELYVDGQVVERWALDGRDVDEGVNLPGERYAFAVARSEDGSGFAVTSPILLAPGGLRPQ